MSFSHIVRKKQEHFVKRKLSYRFENILPTDFIFCVSIRLVNGAYSGPCMKVRRSTDNALQDIYFNGITLDTASLLSFLGGASGFVDTWYDQSSAANHLIQYSASLQPRIVNAGTIDTVNLQPAVKFDGTDDYMSLLTPISGAAPLTNSTVSKRITGATLGPFGLATSNAGTSSPFSAWMYSDNRMYASCQSFSVSCPVGANISQVITGSCFPNSSSGNVYLNGAILTDASVAISAANDFNFMCKRGSQLGNGYMQEHIHWAKNYASVINQIVTNQKFYFNI